MCRTPQAVATALLLLVPGVCAAQSVNMGSTFHGLEARARRVTTTFPDVVIDVRRGEGQAMEAVLRTRAGVEAGRLSVEPHTRRVQWRGGRADARATEFGLPEQATVGLDWAAFQLYALHADATEAGAGACRRRGRGRCVGRPRPPQPSRAWAWHVGRAVGGARRARRDRVRRDCRPGRDRPPCPTEEAGSEGRLLALHGHHRRSADRSEARVRPLVRHGAGADLEDRRRQPGRRAARADARRLDVHADDGVGECAGLPVRHPGGQDTRARGAVCRGGASSIGPRSRPSRRSPGRWRHSRRRRWPSRAPWGAVSCPMCRR